MLRARSLRRLGAGAALVVTAAVGTTGCVLAPLPEPVVVGPPVVVAPRPVIIAPRPRYHYYRGGWHGWHGHRRGHWR
jgi:hypothetical protein